MLVAQKNTGFTLVEILIVVAIIGILAAVGYPSYLKSVRNSARTEAQGVLTSGAAAMERLKANTLSYASGTVGSAATDTVPNRSPTAGTLRYNISFVSTPTATAYIIKAASTDDQDGSGSSTEIMMINQLGQTCVGTKSSSSSTCDFSTDSAW